jgi:hypothetical protein
MTVFVALAFVCVALWKPLSPAGAPASSPAVALTVVSPFPSARRWSGDDSDGRAGEETPGEDGDGPANRAS